MFDFSTRLESVALAAWERWTGNGHKIDRDDWDSTFESTRDAANNEYFEGISVPEWVKRTLARLGFQECEG